MPQKKSVKSHIDRSTCNSFFIPNVAALFDVELFWISELIVLNKKWNKCRNNQNQYIIDIDILDISTCKRVLVYQVM